MIAVEPDALLAREAIRETLARYNMAGDSLRVEEYAAVFTDDGVLETGTVRREGRDAIRDWFGSWREAPAAAAPRRSTTAPRVVRHHLATSGIELLSPQDATALTYWTVYTQIGPDHGGTYRDRLRREGDRWLIAHRVVRTGWYAPNSLFAPVSQQGA